MTSRTKRVAVTGATGFIGRSLVRQLLEADHEVRALTRQPRNSQGITWVHGDLEDETALSELADTADAFIHLAGLTKAVSAAQLMRINADAAGKAATIASQAGVQRFILASSLAASQPHLSHYAASKYAGERVVKAAIGKMDLVIVRPPAVIGPDDPATAQMLDTLKKGWLPVPGGSGRKATRLSFMYMDDVARFFVSQLNSTLADEPIAPCAEAGGVSWNGLAETASHVLSKPVRVIPIAPILLYPAALVAQVATAIFGKSTFFNTGKVREILHTDWTGSVVMADARSLGEALRLAFGVD